MRPEHSARTSRGFALMTAILLVLILAIISAYLVGITTNQSLASAYDLQSAQAVQAARAGIEWGTYQSLRGGSCATIQSLPGLGGFTTTVTCAAANASEDGEPIVIHTISATACNQPADGACPNPSPGQGYVERVFTTTVAAR